VCGVWGEEVDKDNIIEIYLLWKEAGDTDKHEKIKKKISCRK
jgi:hypothetical protein